MTASVDVATRILQTLEDTTLDVPFEAIKRGGEARRTRAARARGASLVAVVAVALLAVQAVLPAGRGGTPIVYAAGIDPTSSFVFTVSQDGRVNTTALPADATDASLSSTGRLAFSAEASDSVVPDIYVATSASAEPRVLIGGPAFDRTPVWSPDGSRIAFVRQTGAEETGSGVTCSPCGVDLFVANADGTDVTAIAEGAGLEDEPAWSPDGTQIAYRSNGEQGHSLYIAEADGSGARTLIECHYCSSPSWSPDGSRIAFVTGKPSGEDGFDDLEIATIDASGLGLEVLTASATAKSHPVWSPDGGSIAFQAGVDSDYATDVYVMSADGSSLQPITEWQGYDGSPRWTPDGKLLLFSDRNAAPDEIARNEADDSPVTGVGLFEWDPADDGLAELTGDRG